MSWLTTYIGYFCVLLCLMTAYMVNCGVINTRTDNNSARYAEPKKRPFCNAFTGCGRKRADPSVPLRPNNNDVEQQQQASPNNLDSGFDETLGDLLDLNSEPAVEDLMRQIMSQAKLWEAIQEANREMTIQRNDRANFNLNRQKFPAIAFNSQ